MHYINLKISSNSIHRLSRFVQFLKTIELACVKGCSRTFKVFVDGDGGTNFYFDFGETDVSKVSELDLDKDEIFIDLD